MFAKLARFNGFGRRHALLSAAKTAHANDNHPIRRVTATLPRARRQILVCGWRQVPATGRLECFWQVEPSGEAVAEEPGISRMIGQSSGCSAPTWPASNSISWHSATRIERKAQVRERKN